MENLTPFTHESYLRDKRLMELLSQNFPSISAASTEIINLEAILNLPKGTEHFIADIHGEHEAFDHIVRNASGNIRRKANEVFGNQMRDEEIRRLCTLIYYPEKKLEEIKAKEREMDDFYNVTLHRLVKVCRAVSSKYTRSKVRKALPKEFAYIIEELLHEDHTEHNKQAYYSRIIETIISTGQADAFIVAISKVIQRLSIDWLHILGDVYDRGPGAHIIMDRLMTYERFDMQWGNHDALWIGAAAGNKCCMANVLRISLRYGNMATLEDGYGINLVPLATFAMETYANDDCEQFQPKLPDDTDITDKNRMLLARMHKAIAIIQFKLEAALIAKRPEWGMEGRNLLHKMDLTAGTIELDGKTYPLLDRNFPTVDPADPYRLTPEEDSLVARLSHSFHVSDKLRHHVGLMFSHGCMYTIINSNLLFHASVPLYEDGSLKEVDLNGKTYKGRKLLHRVGMIMREAFNEDNEKDCREFAIDYFWYLWCGPDSPLFDKSKMTTFERYFIADKETHKEAKGAYFTLRDDPKICDMILDAFGVKGEHRHIINGHVPVKVGKGECPVRADGKLLVIDGGFAKAYHKTTGIAGYTLVYHSRGLQLVQHEPFTSTEEAISSAADIMGTTQIVELSNHRQRVRDTDKGAELQTQIEELTRLLFAYRHGIIKERLMR
jgi:fructose-1,6-bisphosphatase-3